jgi:hypothetical protein
MESIFRKAQVDVDGEAMCIVSNSRANRMRSTAVTVVSTDFSDRPVLTDGKVTRFMASISSIRNLTSTASCGRTSPSNPAYISALERHREQHQSPYRPVQPALSVVDRHVVRCDATRTGAAVAGAVRRYVRRRRCDAIRS